MKLEKKTKAPKKDDPLAEKLAKVSEAEAKLVRLSEDMANLELRLSNSRDEFDGRVKQKIVSFLETINTHMDRIEARTVGKVLDFFGQCPFWEMLKIDDNEHGRTDAAATFAKAIRDGWRYVGHYRDPKNPMTVGYSLLMRPQGAPICESEYLKQMDIFSQRKLAAAKEAKVKPSKSEEKPKLKLKKK